MHHHAGSLVSAVATAAWLALLLPKAHAQAVATPLGEHGPADLSSALPAQGRWREPALSGVTSPDDLAAVAHGRVQRTATPDTAQPPTAQPTLANHGTGLLLKATLQWQGQGWTARAALPDGGWQHWLGLPRQLVVPHSSTLALDADGFLQDQPMLTGPTSQGGQTRSQPWTGSVALARQLGALRSLGLTLRQSPGAPLLPALQWQQRNGALQWGLGWQLQERRASLHLAWGGWALRAGTDRMAYGALSRSLALSWRAPMP